LAGIVENENAAIFHFQPSTSLRTTQAYTVMIEKDHYWRKCAQLRLSHSLAPKRKDPNNLLLLSNARRGRTELLLAPPSE